MIPRSTVIGCPAANTSVVRELEIPAWLRAHYQSSSHVRLLFKLFHDSAPCTHLAPGTIDAALDRAGVAALLPDVWEDATCVAPADLVGWSVLFEKRKLPGSPTKGTSSEYSFPYLIVICSAWNKVCDSAFFCTFSASEDPTGFSAPGPS